MNNREEHRKHQPNCQFITLDKRDEGSLTVKDLFQLMGNLYKQKIVRMIINKNFFPANTFINFDQIINYRYTFNFYFHFFRI